MDLDSLIVNFEYNVVPLPVSESLSLSIRFAFYDVVRPEILLSDRSSDDFLLPFPDQRTIINERVALISPKDVSNDKDDDDHQCEAANAILRDLGMPDDVHLQLLDEISTALDTVLYENWPGGLVVAEVSRVRRIRNRPFENPELDRRVESWIEAHSTGPKPVPAAQSAIRSLARVSFLRGCHVAYERCSICLEEFDEGLEIIVMRCSHAYHGECIGKWLGINHVCPLCRFPVPH